jgi:WD40 repeat protein
MAYLSISSVSYEGSLFGWDLVPARLKSSDGSGESEEFIQCKVTYAFNLTPSSLKCVAISPSGNYLICAGMDEYIRVFDLKKKKSIGDMSGHTGCVTALSFVGNDYIMSASEDCTIIIWSVKNWKKMHILGGHKNTINDFTVHPSGKLAASVSKDNTMKIWNLVHGRCAFTRRLRGPADKIIWHSTQEKYAMVVGNELQIFASTDNNTCTASITYKSRINAVAFVDLGMPADTDNSEIYVAVVCENRSLMIVTDDGTELCKHDMSDLLQQSRPKDIVSTRISLDDVAATSGESVMDTDSDSLVIISSKGHVVVLNAIALISGSDDHDEETDAINEKKKKIGENSIDYAVQAIDQIAVEPRLTAVSGWSLAHQGLVLDEALVDSAEEAVESSADKGSKGSKKGRNNAVSKQDNEASFDKETGGDKKKMKKRDVGDSDGESPGGSKKKKVHFANH